MSNLPKMRRVFSSCFVYGLLLLTGCTAGSPAIILDENSKSDSAPFVVNINSANEHELESLPHVGPSLARKIIEHRERYGPFRKPEHLLVIEGMSEDKFRELRKFINTE